MTGRQWESVAVVGHSFATRLQDSFRLSGRDPSFGLTDCLVKIKGQGGGRVRDIYQLMNNSFAGEHFDAVILLIGGNDVRKQSNEEREKAHCDGIVSEIITLMEWLWQHINLLLYLAKSFV